MHKGTQPPRQSLDDARNARRGGVPEPTKSGVGGAALGTSRTTSGDSDRARLREVRSTRFARGNRSSKLLISEARDSAAFDLWAASTDAGIPVDDDLVRILPSGEIRGNGDALGNVFVRPPRPARCGWALASMVGVHSDGAGVAHFGTNEAGERAVEKCASVAACPTCAAVIRGKRAEDVDRAVSVWQARGGTALFLTLTLRHKRTHSLEESLDTLMQSWKIFQSRQFWAGSGKRSKTPVPGMRDRLGMGGWIRSLEVTYTDASGRSKTGNGWHPHLHLLLLVDAVPESVSALRDEIAHEWRSAVRGRSAEHEPSHERGVNLQTVGTDGKVLAQYLTKVQGESKIGAEMARHDWKTGAKRGSWNPFEFLDESPDEDLNARNAALWLEFVRTMKGRRVIEWSQGLRADLLPDDEEMSDEEVIADTVAAEWLLDLPRKTYRALRRDPVRTAWYLDAVGFDEMESATAFLHGAPPPKKPAPSFKTA